MKEAEKFVKSFTYQKLVDFVNIEAMGGALRTRRLFAKVTLRTMAKTLGYSAPFISDCELGRRSMSLTALQNYLTVLDRARKGLPLS
jgi:predicted transcriptional regulator